MLALALSGCAVGETADVREPPSGRSESQRQEVMSACLSDRGWEIVNASEGEARVAEEQLTLYQDDVESC